MSERVLYGARYVTRDGTVIKMSRCWCCDHVCRTSAKRHPEECPKCGKRYSDRAEIEELRRKAKGSETWI